MTRKWGPPMSAKYFVIDRQGTGWKEYCLWNSVKEIADSIRDYPDCEDDLAALSDRRLIAEWDFEVHRLTPGNCMKYGVRPSDFEDEYVG